MENRGNISLKDCLRNVFWIHEACNRLSETTVVRAPAENVLAAWAFTSDSVFFSLAGPPSTCAPAAQVILTADTKL